MMNLLKKINKENKFSFYSWSAVALCFLVYLFFYVKTGHIYSLDPSQWFFESLQWKGIHTFAKYRFVTFLMQEYPAILSSYIVNDVKVLAYIFSLTFWMWFLISFGLSFFYLKKDERKLLILYPVALCGLVLIRPAFTEVRYSLVFALPIAMILLSKNKITLEREIILYSLILALAFTHQFSLFMLGATMLYLLITRSKDKYVEFQAVRICFLIVALLVSLLYSVVNFGNSSLVTHSIEDFVSLQHFPVPLLYILFVFGTYFSGNKSKKVKATLIVLYLALFVGLFLNYKFQDTYFNYAARVYVMPSFGLTFLFFLFLQRKKTLESFIKQLNFFAPFFCIMTILVSFYCLFEWNKYFRDLFLEVKGRDGIVYFDGGNREKMKINKYGSLADNWSIAAQSIMTQILNDSDGIRAVIINRKDFNSYPDVMMNKISAVLVRKLPYLGVKVSKKLFLDILHFEKKFDRQAVRLGPPK